jgi:hypothetical protein
MSRVLRPFQICEVDKEGFLPGNRILLPLNINCTQTPYPTQSGAQLETYLSTSFSVSRVKYRSYSQESGFVSWLIYPYAPTS